MAKYRAPEPFISDEILKRAIFRPVEPVRIARRAAPWADLGCEAPLRPAVPPPKVTRGERAAELVVSEGKLVEIPARRGWGGGAAIIDWLNVTMDESSFYWGDNGVPVTDDQLIIEVSIYCESIFGFGITAKRDKGANFYHRSWELGEGLGMVCYGGQRDTVLISLSGEGCGAAKPGWENRLYQFLEHQAKRPRITRVDLAHDDFNGSRYSCDKAVADFDAGLFNAGGRTPDIEQRGNWKTHNGKGRTVYVGNRKNGKFARIYEKGRQLGDKESEWVRVEVEFKSVDREIPHDVLIDAGAYLAAAYPAFAWIEARQKRIKTTKKEQAFTYQRMLEWLRHQCGASLWFACEIEGGADKLLAKVMREFDFPKSVKGLKDWTLVGVPIHKQQRVPIGPGQYVQFA